MSRVVSTIQFHSIYSEKNCSPISRQHHLSAQVKERPHDGSHPPQSLLSFWLKSCQNSLRCGPPSPTERAHHSHFFRLAKQNRMHRKSPLRGRGGTAAEVNREYLERLTDAVAVGEMHHSDAPSSKAKKTSTFSELPLQIRKNVLQYSCDTTEYAI